MVDLNEKLIQELIPQVGKRIRFTKKLEEYKLANDTNTLEDLNETELSIDQIPVVCLYCLGFFL